MPRVLLPALLLTLSVPAAAHDVWLQPKAFQFTAPAAAPFVVFVGHSKDRELWSVARSRVLTLTSDGPDGRQNRIADLGTAANIGGVFRLAAPGTYVVALTSSYAISDLPALRFNSYAQEEGLTPAIEDRKRAARTDTNGRELYSRRAKSLIQVGPAGAGQPHVTRPVGLSLEIVPMLDPYRLKPAQKLPVQVIYEGRPLPGALVKLTNLDADAKPVSMHRTDRSGKASFDVPRSGSWLLNVLWTRPITGNPAAEFETTFSSLTFGYPAAASR